MNVDVVHVLLTIALNNTYYVLIMIDNEQAVLDDVISMI